MNNATKAWLITATVLILVGCMIFGGIMTMLKWDFTKLSTAKLETNHHDVAEPFRHITVLSDTADVTFVPSSTAAVDCYEYQNSRHTVTVTDDTLTIAWQDTRKWYDHIGIHFGSPSITVYLPQGKYGSLSVTTDTGDVTVPKDFQFDSIDITTGTGHITEAASAADDVRLKASTGHIRLEHASVGTLNVSVSTGDVAITDMTCENDAYIRVSTGNINVANMPCRSFSSNGSTGDIHLQNVVAADAFSIERSTGDITLDGCDAAELHIQTNTGDVNGTLLTEKIFSAQTNTGRVSVPNTKSGGICQITTDTGHIQMDIAP